MIAAHFADGARDPVNVEGTVRQAVMDNATSAAADLFDAAQKQVSQTVVSRSHTISDIVLSFSSVYFAVYPV